MKIKLKSQTISNTFQFLKEGERMVGKDFQHRVGNSK
jgi:hypothetical protein